MVRVILTLHFYNGSEFLGQKLQWVEVPSTAALCNLLSLLALGKRHHEIHGTEQFPTDSKGFKSIKQELEQVYEPYYCLNQDKIKGASSVRVMQVQEGWPFAQPLVYSSI